MSLACLRQGSRMVELIAAVIITAGFRSQHGVAGVELRLGRLVGFDRLQEDIRRPAAVAPSSTPFSIAPQKGLDSVFISTP